MDELDRIGTQGSANLRNTYFGTLGSVNDAIDMAEMNRLMTEGNSNLTEIFEEVIAE